MSPNCLGLELRLLILKHGKQAVLRELAGLHKISVEEVENQLVALESRKTSKRVRPLPTVEECVAQLKLTDREKENLLRQLARRYEMSSFLPSLRDVERFAAQRNLRVGAKSRREALPRIIQILAELSLPELRDLLETGSDSPEDKGFEVMAGHIMAKA